MAKTQLQEGSKKEIRRIESTPLSLVTQEIPVDVAVGKK